MSDGLAISVVVPVFDRAATVAAAIASVQGANTGRFELIVVDDGSTDGSAAVAQAAINAAGVEGRVLRQANAGPGPARNAGAAAARGDWVAFLDSDDLWFPWTLGTLAATVARQTRPSLTFLQHCDFDDPARLDAEQSGPPSVERHPSFAAAAAAVVAGGPPIRFGAYMVPRETFLALGGFTDAVRCSEDLDLFLRGDALWDCTLIRRPAMVGYRVGGADQLSRNPDRVAEGLAFMMGREAAGDYPGGPWACPARAALHAQSAVYAVRVAFAAGRAGLAYRLLARHGMLVAWRKGAKVTLALALTPALSLLRPRDFPFGGAARTP